MLSDWIFLGSSKDTVLCKFMSGSTRDGYDWMTGCSGIATYTCILFVVCVLLVTESSSNDNMSVMEQ